MDIQEPFKDDSLNEQGQKGFSGFGK